METRHETKLPVAVIGAGPVGLAAAAHLLAQGQAPVVLEAGTAIGASVREWGHVRLFSPWRYNVDAASVALLEGQGWQAPDPDAFPTGRGLVERYLEPLAATPQLAPRIRLDRRVVAVTRQGFDKMKSAGREDAPFLLHLRSSDGRAEGLLARAVIDASGTWRSPNPLGASGLAAPGEAELADRIFFGIPDALGVHRERYAGRRVLVVGSGHSAFNAILDLTTLAGEEPGTTIAWAVRRRTFGQIFGGGENDLLEARGELGQRIRDLVARGALAVTLGFRTAALTVTEEGIVAAGEEGEILPPVDEIVATTGFRPDLAMLRELRLGLDPAVEAPTALAPLIDPNVHSCGTVRPHGAEELAHPERDFYLAGMKSYGRAPTFLLLTGYEQVRSVAAAIAGDWESARDVRLELPETGVCSSGLVASSCCAATPAEELAAVGAPAATGGLGAVSPEPVLVTLGAPRKAAGGACCG